MLDRRGFVKAVAGGFAGLLLPGVALAANKKRPNFLFVLVDDLGATDLRCFGSTFYDTPNLDKLAKSGMKFLDAYAACPVCSPTRAAIMTGRHPVRVNITDWIKGNGGKNRRLLTPEDLHQLPHEETTIAEVLKDNGYQTFFAGKWHLGHKDFWPESQGFDINRGGHHKGSPPGGYYSPYKNPALEDGPDKEYLPDRLTDETIEFIKTRDAKKPFLAYLAFYTVHTPIQAAPRHVKKYRQRADELPELPDGGFVADHHVNTKIRQDRPDYASMVQAMDDNVGRLMSALDQLKLSDDTVVIFTSDNGGLSTLPRPSGPTSNYPLRSGKGWCYEGGIRVPLIIRAPGVTKPGSVTDQPVISMDFFPTMLNLAGIAQKPKLHADGTDLTALIKDGKELKRDAIYWHYPHYHGSGWTPGAAIRAGKWKLIEFFEDSHIELYDLASDPGEQNDLAEKMPEKAAQVYKMLKDWQKKLSAKLPTPNPDYKPQRKNK
jgi:arylsulfatase A-like enzyme